ncbi:DUF6882 domain-containing protein [Flavobacterium foetidum]|uniref:DUF6882 domain-containing protein n=1 Tax=Flavobacterium foetidum TaxID=2026681 RepID=UPI001074A482|nr:DUF6882 domain-containing protein [Flavobacterium foetidum]KAF2513877.1 hypothetical protein E0W73_13700 [Flavobacterium foetidum]
MGFFDKIFKQDKTKTSSNTAQLRTEQQLLERYAGIVMDRQLDFGDLIGENNWNINISNQEISFGADFVFPIQVLGTVSHSSQTWLWSWANKQSGLPESIIQDALKLKKYGEENEIDLLRKDTFSFTKDDLHLMGIIASGINNSSGYYICDYGQGAMVVTIKSEQIDKARTENHLRIMTVFPQLISEFEVNHNTALTYYLTDKGYSISENGSRLIASKNGETVTAEFDELSRLTKLNG